MGRGPRRLVFGLLVLGAALGAGGALRGAEAATTSVTSVVHGGVARGGELTAPRGWRASHVDTGRYRIEAPAGEADLDVPSWTVVADVKIVPLGGGATEVRFRGDGGPIDTDFEFVALVRD